MKKEEERQRKLKCPWVTEVQWRSLEKLSKVPPFHRPSIVDHFLANSQHWQSYIFAKDSESIHMPGNFQDYDFEKDTKSSKLSKDGSSATLSKKKRQKKSDKDTLKEIKEVDEEAQIDDKIWGLDDDDGPATSKVD